MYQRRYLIFAALAAIVLFGLLARWVLAGDSMPLDFEIRDAVHSCSSPAVTGLLLIVTTLGSEWTMLPLGALTAWRLAAGGRRRQAILLAAFCLGAEPVSELLKIIFHRPRPPIFFGLVPAVTYSYPSGHAFVGSVFYGLLAAVLAYTFPDRRRHAIVVAAILALFIGYSRVYLGYHYPTDVLGGWLCAVAWLSLARIWWITWCSVGAPVDAAGKPQEQ